MTCYEILNLFISTLNFAIIAVLTSRIAKANESLTFLQIENIQKEQPILSVWVRNISDREKELTLINSGKKDLLITHLALHINGSRSDWLSPKSSYQMSSLDGKSAYNLAIKSGVIYSFSFGSDSMNGTYPVRLILNNIKNETTYIELDLSRPGPYRIDKDNFFHY